MGTLFLQIENNFARENTFFPQTILTYLECFVASNRIKEGLDFFEKYFSKYQGICNAHPELIQRSIYLYLSINESEKALELTKFIDKDACYHNFVADCYIIAFFNTVETEAQQSLKSYLEKAKSYGPSEDRLELIEHLIRILKENILVNKEPGTLDAFGENLSGDEIIVDDTDYDPKKGHAFYQAQNKVTIGWAIRNRLYRNDEFGLIELSSIHFPNYFAMIDEGLNLDQKNKARFANALRKGFCTRRQSENGIKFLKSTLFELKIDDDLRLYTTKVYQNEDGNRLIIFDQIGNHSKISQLLQTQSQLEVIQVQNKLPKESISDKPSTMFSSGYIADRTESTDLGLETCNTFQN